MRKVSTGLFWAILLVAVLTSSSFAGEVNLSIAASLKDVMNELTDSFGKQNAEAKFLKNYGGSGALAKQIENGAPADIFISANVEWMDYLQSRKLMSAASIGIFVYNTLVFAGRTDKKVSGIHDLPKLEKIAIGSPKSVPAGEYAMEAIKKAALDKQLERKLVMARDVRECLMYAERGEVDGAFAYKTDALLSKRVKIQFPVAQALYSRVVYLTALTISGAGNQEAVNFFGFLRSVGAKGVLIKYGFELQ